jgi:hypothetical protein
MAVPWRKEVVVVGLGWVASSIEEVEDIVYSVPVMY